VSSLTVKQLLIVYFSGEGSTKKMAEEICKGASRSRVQAKAICVEECKLNDLVKADGIVVGSPTYFSNVAWQVKKLIDESIELYRKGHALRDKVGGCFTSAGTHRDGKSCIRLLEVTFGFHHRMKIVPGIISTSGDEETQVSKMCQQYGEEIAKQILS
jgi:NAD(P)H dehydrogenase (quinone)